MMLHRHFEAVRKAEEESKKESVTPKAEVVPEGVSIPVKETTGASKRRSNSRTKK